MPDRALSMPDRSRIGFGAFAGIAIQVGLVLAAAVMFRIELERGFGTIAALLFGGFLIHAWLPIRWRVPFFVLLTMAALGWLLRFDAVWLVALGLGILGLCHLPIAWGARAALVAAAGAVLAAVMAGRLEAPWGEAVIPILAAMFMFRIFLYLYDLKTDRTPATPWQRIAYFFLLPNVSFPLFPVVDYKSFLRGYYDAPAAEIYQKGAYWMLRGVTHLILYRLVYHVLPLTETDLSGVVGVYAFMALTYGLYLRVSGLFHLIVGSLCLFGFNLPTTNHHYFLASSFNDLWRRINIYWKDFMMTVAFYPAFMRFRRWSMSTRLIVATMIVFVITWFLHSYQWFWLRGVLPLTATDGVFWGTLGVALAINTVWEARHGRRRRLGKPAWSTKAALVLTLRVVAFFTFMAVMWSLWNGGSFAEWGYRLLQVRETEARGWAIFGGGLIAVIALGTAAQWLQYRGWGIERWEKTAWRHAPVYVPAVALAILVVGLPSVHDQIGGPIAAAVNKAQSTKLNRIDRERQERGYYETLSRATKLGPMPDRRRNDDLPEDWIGFRNSPAARMTGDLRGWTIVPGVVTEFKGVTFRANRWGMRDREYELEKPAGTYRMALVGFSHEMGSGVENDETFENVLEDRLNRELAGRGHERYEILNFSVGGYGLLQALYVAEHQVPPFHPDVVLYVVHPGEAMRLVDRLLSILQLGARLDEEYAELARIAAEARVGPNLPAEEFARRLHPYRDELVGWAHRRMIESIRSQGAEPVFVFIPITGGGFRRTELEKLMTTARESGATVLDLSDVYEGYPLEQIQVATWDNHPNPLGHRLIADRLHAELMERADSLGLLEPRRTASTP